MIIESTTEYKLNIKRLKRHNDCECDGRTANLPEFLTFNAYEPYDELVQIFTTRKGGVSTGCCESWNFGSEQLDSMENILKNYEILGEIMEVPATRMLRGYQVHSAKVKAVTEADCGNGIVIEREDGVDGLVTNVRGLAIFTSHADCNGITYYDPVNHAIGVAHSGWKGTLAEIAKETVRTMKEAFGTNPSDLICGIGPALCQDCFEVDTDVAEMFLRKDPRWEAFSEHRGIKYYIDLKKIIKMSLADSGVSAHNIHDMELCTKCHNDIFFSHRGQKGKRGLMVSGMMLRK